MFIPLSFGVVNLINVTHISHEKPGLYTVFFTNGAWKDISQEDYLTLETEMR